MVYQHPIVLLGHPPVMAAQTRLYVNQRDLESVRGETTGEGRVGVSLDHDSFRPILRQILVEGRDGRPDLAAACHPTHCEIDFGFAEAERLDEDPGEATVVVLACVDDPRGRAEKSYDMGQLDDLRPGSQHDRDGARGEGGDVSRRNRLVLA